MVQVHSSAQTGVVWLPSHPEQPPSPEQPEDGDGNQDECDRFSTRLRQADGPGPDRCSLPASQALRCGRGRAAPRPG